MSDLCRMALGTRYEDLPPEVARHARHTLLDTMAVTIGGSAMEGVPAIVELIKDKGGKPETPLPFYGGRYPAADVAQALGAMSRAMDCCDLHDEAGIVSGYIVPAVLCAAAMMGKVSGKEFLTALVIGQEILVRIGSAYKVIRQAVKHGDCGGHYIFGAVAAVGRLMGLSQEQLENAQGIARTMTQPHTMAIFTPATLMVRVHHGLVCQAAINVCLLASKGITGPRREVLLGPTGYLNTVRWETDSEHLTRDLGAVWQMENIISKGHTACYFTHSSIDGILDQRSRHGFEPGDISGIHIDVSAECWRVVCEPMEKKWNPQTMPECQFSLPYVVAYAALEGKVFLEAYSSQARARQDLRELMGRITARIAPDLNGWAARVTTTLHDGRVFSRDYAHVKGHPRNPFDEQDFVNKFRMCVPHSARDLEPEVVDMMIQNILHLEESDDVVARLLMPLIPEP